MKGVLESIPEFFHIVIALAVIVILFLMIYQFSNAFNQSDEVTLKGTKTEVAKNIAKYVYDCWVKHRSGLDPDSAVCKTMQINSTETISEYDVTKFLDCSAVPNNDCSPDDCSFCTSPKYPQQDKLRMENIGAHAAVKISYSGALRAIEVEEV